jgi:hypothetical protein
MNKDLPISKINELKNEEKNISIKTWKTKLSLQADEA